MPVCPTSHYYYLAATRPLNIATDEYHVPKVQASLSRITTHIPGGKKGRLASTFSNCFKGSGIFLIALWML